MLRNVVIFEFIGPNGCVYTVVFDSDVNVGRPNWMTWGQFQEILVRLCWVEKAVLDCIMHGRSPVQLLDVATLSQISELDIKMDSRVIEYPRTFVQTMQIIQRRPFPDYSILVRTLNMYYENLYVQNAIMEMQQRWSPIMSPHVHPCIEDLTDDFDKLVISVAETVIGDEYSDWF